MDNIHESIPIPIIIQSCDNLQYTDLAPRQYFSVFLLSVQVSIPLVFK